MKIAVMELSIAFSTKSPATFMTASGEAAGHQPLARVYFGQAW
jgi:hypothetical protein